MHWDITARKYIRAQRERTLPLPRAGMGPSAGNPLSGYRPSWRIWDAIMKSDTLAPSGMGWLQTGHLRPSPSRPSNCIQMIQSSVPTPLCECAPCVPYRATGGIVTFSLFVISLFFGHHVRFAEGNVIGLVSNPTCKSLEKDVAVKRIIKTLNYPLQNVTPRVNDLKHGSIRHRVPTLVVSSNLKGCNVQNKRLENQR